MTAPVQPAPIDLLPVGPRPIDTEEEFNAKSFATIEAQEAMVPQINAATAATYQNAIASDERAVAADASKNAAAESAGTATTEANRSRDEADRSEAAKQAALAAAAAAGAAAGLPSMAGKAGQALVVLPDETGAGWSVLNSRGSQDFTASQNINKSIFGTATYVLVELWGGGGSGSAARGSSSPAPSGGEGGSYAAGMFFVSDLPDVIPLVVGAGGAPVVSSSAVVVSGISGGDTSFGADLLKAVGGLGPRSGYQAPMRSGRVANGGEGGGAGSPNVLDCRPIQGIGGNSTHGGGGGGGAAVILGVAAGTSIRGGNGGDGYYGPLTNSVAASGAFPGGGGGGIAITNSPTTGTATSGAGGAGMIRLTWW